MTAKAERQRLIAGWLRGDEVGSQEDLVARLAKAGIAATQATVSRDLDELGAARVRRDGVVRYVLPQVGGAGAPRLGRVLADWVQRIVPAGSLVVLTTPPGSANMVASAIDQAALAEVAGTIAGDDTIFVALHNGVDPDRFAALLEKRRRG